jgi:hypothetical protein
MISLAQRVSILFEHFPACFDLNEAFLKIFLEQLVCIS